MKKINFMFFLFVAILNEKSANASDHIDILIEGITRKIVTQSVYIIITSYEDIMHDLAIEEEKRKQDIIRAQEYEKILIEEQEKDDKRNKRLLAKQEKSRKSQLENTRKQKEDSMIARQKRYQENLDRIESIKKEQRENSKKTTVQEKICIKNNPPTTQENQTKKKRSRHRKHATKELVTSMINSLLNDETDI